MVNVFLRVDYLDGIVALYSSLQLHRLRRQNRNHGHQGRCTPPPWEETGH